MKVQSSQMVSVRWTNGVLALLCLVLWTSEADAQIFSWPRQVPPAPLEARPVKFPPYEVRTLDNGMQVLAVLHHEQPVVSVRLLLRFGAAQDPVGKFGTASLVAALLDDGTTTRTSQDIAGTIDSIGGALGTGAGNDLIFVNVMVMKDSFDLALDLVADLVRNPIFSLDEIERQRQQLTSGFKVSYEDPDYVAAVVHDRLVFGFQAYGFPTSGTPDSVARITREDLLAFHKTYFSPNDCVVAIVGDVTAEEAFDGVERVFGSWRRKETPNRVVEDPPEPTRRLIVVDKPDAVQTEIRVGHLSIPRKHPDYLALNLAIKILGGEGGNRLQRVLRSEHGLTYGAGAIMRTLAHSGSIVADTDTQSSTTAEALRLIVDEFWKLQRGRVGPYELSDAQAYLSGHFPLTIETPGEIARQLLNAAFFGLSFEELESYRERLQAVTIDDIRRVVRTHLKPNRLSVVLVGNATEFVQDLKKLGFSDIELVHLDDLDLTVPDFRRSNTVTH